MYLDANFFIICYLDTGQEGDKCRELIKGIVKEHKHASTSILAIDEAVYIIKKLDKEANYKSVWSSLVSIPNLVFLPIGLESTKHVATLLEKGLKPRDAIHASIMLNYGMDTLVSNDSDYDKIKEIKRLSISEL